MAKFFRLTVFLFCTVLAGKAYALETQHVSPVGEWLTEPVSDDGDAEIDFCLVRNYFSNGLIMILAEDKSGARRMALNFPSNRLSPGQQHPISLSIDNIWRQDFTAVAADEDMLVIPLVSEPAMWDRLSKGYVLKMTGKNDAVEFDLTGTGDALNTLQECVQSRLVREEEPIVAAADPNEIQSFQSQEETALQPELPNDVFDILYAAGYKKINPVRLKGDAESRPLDLAWTMDGLFAGYKKIVTDKNLRDISQDYFRMVRPVCSGPFVAEGSPSYEVAGIPFMRAEIGCSGTTKDTISSVLFFKLGGTVTVFFMEAGADEGAKAIKARNRIARVAERAVSNLD